MCREPVAAASGTGATPTVQPRRLRRSASVAVARVATFSCPVAMADGAAALLSPGGIGIIT